MGLQNSHYSSVHRGKSAIGIKKGAYPIMRKKSKSDTYAVIGVGRFGAAAAKQLAAYNKEVIVIDKDENALKQLRDITEYAYVTDNLSRASLEEMGVDRCSTVIIGIGEGMDTSILTTLNVTKLGVDRVIAKAMSAEHGAVLEMLGAEVVYPERDMALRLANNLLANNVLDSIMLNDDIEIAEIAVSSVMKGKKIIDLPLRKKYGLNIIAIQHDTSTDVEIDPQYELLESDTLVVIGRREKLRLFMDKISKY